MILLGIGGAVGRDIVTWKDYVVETTRAFSGG